ncbi:MAG: hypothetical protein ACYDBJ_28090 [Aggregatilineales bacterium]
MTAVLETLMDTAEDGEALATEANAPNEVLDAFRKECKRAELIDDVGNFTDALKLVHFFCNAPPPKVSPKKLKSRYPNKGQKIDNHYSRDQGTERRSVLHRYLMEESIKLGIIYRLIRRCCSENTGKHSANSDCVFH